MTAAFPLQWPVARPRKSAGARRIGKFNKKSSNGRSLETKAITVADALGRLQEELDRIGARYPVVSTNIETRLDGLPRSGQSEPADPGVALYFDLAGKPHCMPCDTYDKVAQNIAAIAAHIEATRAIERHGVSSVAEMFAGFTALPGPDTKRPWRQVLMLVNEPHPTREQVERNFKLKARRCHPDHGGSNAAMAELNAARDQALNEIGQ